MPTTVEMLEDVYGQPHARALHKELTFLSDDYRAFVEASPFVVLSSVGRDGTDCSPRGDRPGFVRVIDRTTLAIPDRPGNNRIDSLRNIVEDGRVSLLFLVPGIGETLRVNGHASIANAAEFLSSFAVDGKAPKTVVIVAITSVYFHCAKAIVRANLWDPTRHVDRTALPSAGAIHERLSDGTFDGMAYDRAQPARIKDSLY